MFKTDVCCKAPFEREEEYVKLRQFAAQHNMGKPRDLSVFKRICECDDIDRTVYVHRSVGAFANPTCTNVLDGSFESYRESQRSGD